MSKTWHPDVDAFSPKSFGSSLTPVTFLITDLPRSLPRLQIYDKSEVDGIISRLSLSLLRKQDQAIT